ncbi:MAG TPA: LuxR C-terminal-related transcriptional regulator [Anaerolineae bacterium]|nr:LuxR C-terminal-related transcriptional regulator [Anaerolineae bacterium]
MQQYPLLQTKLYIPPVRPELVSRPRLIEQLNAGLDRKLTLLSAQAGFGKTTLLSDWVGQHEGPVAWLSLDDGDNEPGRFWTYLVAALQRVHADMGQESLNLLQATQPPPVEAILSPLLNEFVALAQTPPAAVIVLVLDDYHLISTPQIHEGIAFLLEHQPHNLHLVISTRADPHLPTFRLRARGQLTDLRSDDLRFTSDEVAAFLNTVMSLDLAPADVEALEIRTEGWIVGLQLAALSLQGRADASDFIAAFGGSHRYILEYLTEEVLARQAEPVRQFLLQTSILDRLYGPLCDSVMEWEHMAPPDSAQSATTHLPSAPSARLPSQKMLEQLDEANLFVVPLDDERLWYRYHRLFADLLRKQLGQQVAPGQVAGLLERASAWHEAHGSLDEAVLYALQARDYERVVRLVEEAASAGRLESRLTTMLRWLEAVPEEMLLLRPRLRIYQAWALIINEQLDLAKQVLSDSSDALQFMPSSPDSEAVRGEVDALLSLVEMMASALATAYGGEHLEKAFQAAQAAREKGLAAGNVFLAAHATNGLAMARFHQGRLSEAAEYYRQLVDLGMQGTASQLPLAAVGQVGLATICLERNELDAAERHVDEGLRLGKHGVGTNTLVSASVTLSRLRQYSGDGEGALEALDEVERLGHVRDSAPAVHRLTRQRAWLKLYTGELEGTDHLVKRLHNLLSHEKFGETIPVVFYEAQQLWLARLHLLRDEAGAALDLLEPIHEGAKVAGRLGRVIEICLLKALAWQALGDKAAALTALQESLALAEPEGYLRVYLDEGARLLPLLSALERESLLPRHLQRHARKLVNALDVDAGQRKPSADDPYSLLVEPLTKRELQVLRLMVAGLSSLEIADELVIAVSTARTHIKNIYSKLSVRSRYEAIERAKQLQLL